MNPQAQALQYAHRIALAAAAEGIAHADDVRAALKAVVNIHEAGPNGVCTQCPPQLYPCVTAVTIADLLGVRVWVS